MDVDLVVPEGSVFGLLGPNGSGKSTFISLLAAAEQPQSGSLRLLGHEPRPGLRARIGTVFQEGGLDPTMTPRELLQFFARLFGVARPPQRMAEVLGVVGLTARADDRIATLSGGMRRRLEVARALLHQPDVLLLDEPTAGVDPGEREALWSALAGGRGGRTVVVATNDLIEAEAVCDQVAFLAEGRLVASGTSEALKRGLRRETVRVVWPGVADGLLEAVGGWEGVGALVRDGDQVHITTDDGATLVPRLFALGVRIQAVRIDRTTLQDAYFQHLGRGRAANCEGPK